MLPHKIRGPASKNYSKFQSKTRASQRGWRIQLHIWLFDVLFLALSGSTFVYVSRNDRSIRDRLGCFSLRNAFASI